MIYLAKGHHFFITCLYKPTESLFDPPSQYRLLGHQCRIFKLGHCQANSLMPAVQEWTGFHTGCNTHSLLNLSPIYTAENFWCGSDESGTRTQKIVLITHLHVLFSTVLNDVKL